jgi:trans-aconitate methyltransferase
MNSLDKILEILNAEKQQEFCKQYEAHLRREFFKDAFGATIAFSLVLFIVWAAHFIL